MASPPSHVQAMRERVGAMEEGHPDRGTCLMELSDGLAENYSTTGSQEDLEESIRFLLERIQLVPEEQPIPPSCLDSFETRLSQLYPDIGVLQAPAGCVTAGGQSGDLSQTQRLSLLSERLCKRYLEDKDPKGLDQSIALGRLVIRETTKDGRNRVADMNAVATALCYRYERTKNPTDLDEAIGLLRAALDLTTNGHSNRPLLLSNLSLQFQDKYEATGEMTHLVESIDLIQSAIDLTPEEHPNWPIYVHNLSVRLYDRYAKTESPDILEQSLDAAQKAVDLTLDGEPNRPLYLHNLGLRLENRYDRTGQRVDLERSYAAAEESLRGTQRSDIDYLGRLANVIERRRKLHDLTPATNSSSSERARHLSNISVRWRLKYAETGDPDTLERAISAAEHAIGMMPTSHPNSSELLANLALCLRGRYAASGAVDDLERAIGLTRQALALKLDDPGARQVNLHNLGTLIGERYTRFKRPTDLDESIRLLEEAIDASQDDRPGGTLLKCNLALQLGERFDTGSGTEDLEKAIELMQEAVHEAPITGTHRVGHLYNLSMLLCKRYTHTSAATDLEQTIQVARQVIEATPENHPDKPVYVHSLGQRLSDRYAVTGEIADLEESIEAVRRAIYLMPDKHPSRSELLCSLAHGLLDRYSRTGELSDLEASIQSASQGVNLTASDHPDRPSFLTIWSNGLSDRYFRLGMMADLEESIRLKREAIDAMPDDAVELPRYLYNLGARLGDRYLRNGLLRDLNSSIDVIQKAADATPRDHVNWAVYLNGLGTRLLDRYRNTEDDRDIERAIGIAREIIDATPDRHPQRPRYMHALCLCLSSRYRTQRRAADLDESIDIGRATLKAVPEDHPERAYFVNFLGGRLGHRFGKHLQDADFEDAVSHYRSALYQVNAPTQQRLAAGRKLLLYYAMAEHWEEAYHTAHGIIDLLPRLTGRSQDHSDRQYWMGQVSGLASDAAAVTLLAGKEASVALGFLEQGRGVIASSLEDIRADMADLGAKHPDLVQRFHELRDTLESRTTQEKDGFGEDRGSKRYTVGKLFDELLADIRNQSGFERFLLPPRGDELSTAAVDGPIVIINVSQYQCAAIIVERCRIWSRPLARLTLGEIERKAYQNYLESQDALEWLWDVAMMPILDALGHTQDVSTGAWPHVWWIPTGALAQYPLHAAGYHGQRSGRGTVLDRVISSYSTSVRALLKGRERASIPTTHRQALLVAMEHTANKTHLEHAATETATIRPLLASMDITPIEPGRCKSDILTHLPQCSIFHFSGHGSSHASDPSRSSLLLEDWQEDPLEVSNLLDMDLRRHAPFLAYLSACGTGQICDARYTDESIHLIGAFQLAGFRHVIGTLWQVSDQECVEMAKITYERIRDGRVTDRSVAEGVHLATRALRAHWQKDSRKRSGREAQGNRNDRPGRDANISDEDEVEGSLNWVPYVHFGV